MIAVFPASKIENEPYWCARNDPEWQIQNVLEISLIVDHFRRKTGKLWENVKYIQNVPSFLVSLTFPYNVPKVSPIFAKVVH